LEKNIKNENNIETPDFSKRNCKPLNVTKFKIASPLIAEKQKIGKPPFIPSFLFPHPPIITQTVG
jgi:hypothetical protein